MREQDPSKAERQKVEAGGVDYKVKKKSRRDLTEQIKEPISLWLSTELMSSFFFFYFTQTDSIVAGHRCVFTVNTPSR